MVRFSFFIPSNRFQISFVPFDWLALRRVHSTVSDSFALSSGSLLFLRFSIRAVRSLCSAGSRFTVCFRFVLNVSLLFLRFSSQFRGLAHMSRSVSSGRSYFSFSDSLVLSERFAPLAHWSFVYSLSSGPLILLRFCNPRRTLHSDSLVHFERPALPSQIL